ncbi:MAG: hypothetical protein HFG36_08250 [Eubacterium sp.]|nr:hypothetical protein [Eubacterium sp.]
MQDLVHILHEEITSLYFSFGNYFDKPAAEKVGQKIAEELGAAGFSYGVEDCAKQSFSVIRK